MRMIEDLGLIHATAKSTQRRHYAIYACPFCGKPFRTLKRGVMTGTTKSCGCQKKTTENLPKKKHGMYRTRIYSIWGCMKRRCHNPNNADYARYGGRGIGVCDEWKSDFMIFHKWALENGYTEKLEIDRKDNEGNYCPENCRWVTRAQNVQNKGKSLKNKRKYKGVYPVHSRWLAEIYDNRHKVNLGRYDTEEEAALAYNNYVIENHTFHELNKIDENVPELVG